MRTNNKKHILSAQQRWWYHNGASIAGCCTFSMQENGPYMCLTLLWNLLWNFASFRKRCKLCWLRRKRETRMRARRTALGRCDGTKFNIGFSCRSSSSSRGGISDAQQGQIIVVNIKHTLCAREQPSASNMKAYACFHKKYYGPIFRKRKTTHCQLRLQRLAPTRFHLKCLLLLAKRSMPHRLRPRFLKANRKEVLLWIRSKARKNESKIEFYC